MRENINPEIIDKKMAESFDKYMFKMHISEAVYLTLKESIMERCILPGAKINPTQISDLLSISLTPIKEALRKLEYEDLISSYKGNSAGYYVCELSLSESKMLLQHTQGLYTMTILSLEKNIDSYNSQIINRRLNELEKTDDIMTFLDDIRLYYLQYATCSPNRYILQSLSHAVDRTRLMNLYDMNSETSKDFIKKQCLLERELYDSLHRDNNVELFRIIRERNRHIGEYMLTHVIHDAYYDL